MSIRRGGRSVTKLYRGGQEVVKAYRGTDVVYEADNTTRLYFTLSSSLTQNLYFTQSAANGVTIDWGDGSATETVADLAASASHTYAEAGNYVVSMTAADGVTWSPGAAITSGSTTSDYGLLGPTTVKSTTYPTLTAFEFGDGCTLARANSFTQCTGLTSIVIPQGTTTIPEYAFYKATSLRNVSIPNGVTTIGQNAFWLCALRDVTIPDSVTRIGDGAFYTNSYLSEVSIGTGVTSIGSEAFYMCGLTSVTIPGSVRTIGSAAFGSCSQLTHAEVAAAALYGGVFGGCTDLVDIWLRHTVETISASSNTSGIAYQAEGLTIYAEVSAKPNGWGEYYDVVKVANTEGVSTITRAPVVFGQATRPW